MRSLLLIACASMALTACGPGEVLSGGSIPVESPAPAATTTIDDSALEMAWKGFDAALDAIALARTAGVLKPGTPKAIKVADGIDKVLAAFKAAEHAAAGLSTQSYAVALDELKAALTDFRSVLRSN